jgi:hypothetical protein
VYTELTHRLRENIMAVSLAKKPTLNEIAQQIADRDFVLIVGHLTDLGVLSEYIVTAYDMEN